MKGRYQFRVKSKKVLFDFTIRRNITVIKGDSATGKTTLLHMLYEYLRVGRESGYSVAADVKYFVYLRREVGRDWQDALLPLEHTVIFIEENNNFVFSEEFAEFVRNSDNYFVLVNRSPFKMLPYSVHEIYEIVTHGQRADMKESYHVLRELYSNYPVIGNNQMRTVITEDSNAGHQFFSHILKGRKVHSASGNGNVICWLRDIKEKEVLVIADGAAFGAMMEECMELIQAQSPRRIAIWLPESFEYLILQSGLVQAKNLPDILENTSDYVESSQFESWERYYTELLTTLTEGTLYQYMKRSLNPCYLQERNVKKIAAQFPEVIRDLVTDCLIC